LVKRFNHQSVFLGHSGFYLSEQLTPRGPRPSGDRGYGPVGKSGRKTLLGCRLADDPPQFDCYTVENSTLFPHSLRVVVDLAGDTGTICSCFLLAA
jgi:hypothetical protein